MRVVSPTIAQLPHLHTPLTVGEWAVFRLFHALLPEDWEIYVQPHLNGLRPDFVLLHPNVGIAVFKVGLEVVTRLGNQGVKTVHTFSHERRNTRRLKLGFFMGDARVKATTLHNFKGWETRSLVVDTGLRLTPKALALTYTGLTRVKRHAEHCYITVVSTIPELAEYGRTWMDYLERRKDGEQERKILTRTRCASISSLTRGDEIE